MIVLVKKKFLYSLLVGLGLLLVCSATLALAQTYDYLDARVEGEDVYFTGNKAIRYQADYDKFTLTLPNTQLSSYLSRYPAGYKVLEYPDHILVSVGEPFSVTISPDELTLYIRRGQVLGSEPEAVEENKVLKSSSSYSVPNSSRKLMILLPLGKAALATRTVASGISFTALGFNIDHYLRSFLTSPTVSKGYPNLVLLHPNCHRQVHNNLDLSNRLLALTKEGS